MFSAVVAWQEIHSAQAGRHHRLENEKVDDCRPVSSDASTNQSVPEAIDRGVSSRTSRASADKCQYDLEQLERETWRAAWWRFPSTAAVIWSIPMLFLLAAIAIGRRVVKKGRRTDSL
jgi:hypothetical protein